MSDARLARIFEFLKLAEKLKAVYRSAWLTDHSRRENDAEHMWHMALFALLFHREFKIEADLGRTLELILCHDLVEVLAGDCNVYDTAARAAQAEREEAAARELFAVLPDDLRAWVDACWREFEAAATPEAKFAKAMDRLQAMGQNCFSGGQAWRERGITEARSRAVNRLAWEACPPPEPAFDWIFAAARAAALWAPEENER